MGPYPCLLVPVALAHAVQPATARRPVVRRQAAAAATATTTYVACSTKASAKPTHECKLSQTKAAFFVSSEARRDLQGLREVPGQEEAAVRERPGRRPRARSGS